MAMKFDLALVNFMDGADVGMIQGGGRASFASKAFEACGSSATFSGRNFKRRSPMARVYRFVYNTHATTDAFEYAGNGEMFDRS